MSSNITLSAATRQNLLSLQDTAQLTGITQNRLATGKKVNSALDNPLNYFTALNLTSRSSELGGLLDGISNGIQVIQAANQGITSIQKIVDQAKSIANQALSTQITTTGKATTEYSANSASTSISFYVNGALTSASIAQSASILDMVKQLNEATNGARIGNAFSVDSTGKKIVLNASADVEFVSASDQTALGFTAGSTNSSALTTYGTASTAVGQSSDLTVSGVKARATLAEQYNNLLNQITQLATDASFNGVNLINGKNNDLTINFNTKGSSNLVAASTDETAAGLGLTPITNQGDGGTTVGRGSFLLNADINTVLKDLTKASDQLRADATTLGSNLSVVQNRQDFSKQLINVLDTGAANLTNADLNEEAANSQALSTRQSLGISALSLANQAQQSILQLLR
ncbi:flagellin [uncultured Methylobacterium sp.]|mgnify:CR=1 FL=1|jgi:flagellin|uniref:flagellin N-terminal helical domain-containing protein n=1 Tax=uncultured Methylobacterium sp. TaxID=157278 RepID=UPI00261FF61C|nr:flagellin [uncultured Methylobacterium sp.]